MLTWVCVHTLSVSEILSMLVSCPSMSSLSVELQLILDTGDGDGR